jgi:hypothetical protein
MNRDCDYDAVLEDYYSHIYGEDWKEAKALFEAVENVFEFAYMEGECGTDTNVDKYYNPEYAAKFVKVPELAARARVLSADHAIMPTRPQTVSWQLMGYYAEYLEHWGRLMTAKALGNTYEAREIAKRFTDEFGRHEVAIERYYDHGLLGHIVRHVIKITTKEVIW